MANGNQETPGSVASGIVHAAEPGPEVKRLEVFIGRWINEGYVVREDGTPGSKILTSDVYEWAPGRFFVIHPAYGRIGDAGVGGVEIIGYDTANQKYRSHFFDSQGNSSVSELIFNGETWIFQDADTRCTSVFSEDGNTQTAHHERRDQNGNWVPSMEVVLAKVS